MKFDSILKIEDHSTLLTFNNLPEVVLSVSDEKGNSYRLELCNRRIPSSFGLPKSWCNGWFLNNKIIQTKPKFEILENHIDSYKILNKITYELNKYFLPEFNFLNIELDGVSEINYEVLSKFSNQVFNYLKEIDGTTSIQIETKKYLFDLSLFQLISILNYFKFSDRVKVINKKDNNTKVYSDKFEYECVLLNVENILKFTFKDYSLGFIFSYFSNDDIEVNTIIDSRFKFDYFFFKQNFVVNYISIPKVNKIQNKKVNNIQNKSNKNCFIVTTTMGDINHPVVVDFRRYRDEVLLNTYLGRVFINIYYRIGPVLSKVIKTNSFLFTISKKLVLRLHKRLR